MGGNIPKQFMELNGRPILYYTLKAYQEADLIDRIILVTGKDLVSYCEEEIVKKYQIVKADTVVPGGKERYDSVYAGLRACGDTDYVFIQDGVRPFVTEEILTRGLDTARKYSSAVAGMPSKDTVRLAGADGKVLSTLDRSSVWLVQTPQIFRYQIIRSAYDSMQSGDWQGVTDDAMVWEKMTGEPVRMFEGSYRNIKITTPEDLAIAEKYLE